MDRYTNDRYNNDRYSYQDSDYQDEASTGFDVLDLPRNSHNVASSERPQYDAFERHLDSRTAQNNQRDERRRQTRPPTRSSTTSQSQYGTTHGSSTHGTSQGSQRHQDSLDSRDYVERQPRQRQAQQQQQQYSDEPRDDDYEYERQYQEQAIKAKRTTEFNPYTILGVEKNSKLSEIKKRYYRLVKRYHPDRNPEDAQKIALITKAYNILSDPTQRAMYDNSYTPGIDDLRNAHDNYSALQAKQRQDNVKDKFGKSDLEQFNQEFEKRRTRDPNDHGYGDGMAARLDTKDVVGGQSRRDQLSAPENLFKGQSFDPNLFNRMFEQMNQHSTGTALMERSEDDPSGFSLHGGQDYTEIALYNGAMILGKETDDYSTNRDGMGFGDYQRSYALGKNPNKIDSDTIKKIRSQTNPYEDSRLTKNETDRMLNARLREFNEPLINVPQNERKKRYKEMEWQLEQQRQDAINREQEEHKQVVFKYKDQYPQHLLADLNIREEEPHNQQAVADGGGDPRSQRTFDDLMKERMGF